MEEESDFGDGWDDPDLDISIADGDDGASEPETATPPQTDGLFSSVTATHDPRPAWERHGSKGPNASSKDAGPQEEGIVPDGWDDDGLDEDDLLSVSSPDIDGRKPPSIAMPSSSMSIDEYVRHKSGDKVHELVNISLKGDHRPAWETSSLSHQPETVISSTSNQQADVFIDSFRNDGSKAAQSLSQKKSDSVDRSAGLSMNKPSKTNGWGDDDDFFSDEKDLDDDTAGLKGASTTVNEAVSTGKMDQELEPKKSFSAGQGEQQITNPSGWGDDDDLFSDESNDTPKETVIPSEQISLPAVLPSSDGATDGWNDDFSFNDEDAAAIEDGDSAPTVAHPSLIPVYPAARSRSHLYQDLEEYLDLLPHLTTSIHAVLEAEYNIPEKASELLQYYEERPGLLDYTVNKELLRMDYELIEPNPRTGGCPITVTDKTSIAQALRQDEMSLTGRCANQSLLADLLQVLTGPDRVVRPQYMATAVATSCNFQLDLQQSWVQCRTRLDLGLPTEDGRWKVANLDVYISVVLNPEQPYVEYQLEAIHPVARNADWAVKIQRVVEVLESLDLADDHSECVDNAHSDIDYRDAFLQQSQSLMQNSVEGMRSTLQEIDSITGLSSKMKRMPAFLPDDVIQAAEEHTASSPHHRPQSILGGFMRQGLSRLAKQVALPEEDPTIYEEWKGSAVSRKPMQPRGQSPTLTTDLRGLKHLHEAKLYRSVSPKHPTVSPQVTRSPKQEFPKLYFGEAEADRMESISMTKKSPRSGGLQLYREENRQTAAKPESPVTKQLVDQNPSKPPTLMFPKLYGTESVSTSPQNYGSESQFPLPRSHSKLGRNPLPDKSVPQGDGWDDHDDFCQGISDGSFSASDLWQSGSELCAPIKPSFVVDDPNFVYNPVDGIIPTRTRWVNPYPGSRRLSSFQA
jgi:hypothetical protein